MAYITDLEAANAHPENPWLRGARKNVEAIDIQLRQLRLAEAV